MSDPTEAEWLEGNDPVTERERMEDVMTTDNRTNELNKYAGFVARQNHQRDPWRGIGKKCLCGVVFDSDVDHAMHQVEAILEAALVAAASVAPVVQRVGESGALALVEDVIAIHADRIGTHYEDCYKYHVACLAVAVKRRLGGGSR